MNEINIDEVKRQLHEFAKSYRRPTRGKFAVLMPLRDEILELSRRGAACGDIASILAQHQVPVSKDTVGRFLREEMRKEKVHRAAEPGLIRRHPLASMDERSPR